MVKLVDDLLVKVINQRASDVHFEPGDEFMLVRQRLDGVLHTIDRLPRGMSENVIARLKVLGELLTYRVDIPQEGSFIFNDERLLSPVDLRVATFPTIRGERAVVRLLHQVSSIAKLEDLGFNNKDIGTLTKAASRPHGLILITGPAGSGKSTTLYTLARQILSATAGRSVVSLEDPVESRINGLVQIQIQPHGELNYVRAMRSLLRQDVQVLLVGEIRDAETAHIVIEAALTGHLILSTMHSGDPAETLARLLEMGIPPYQIVSALTLVGAQRLLRTVCTQCGGSGCASCQNTGFSGRTACGQMVPVGDDIRQAVLRHSTTSQMRELINRNYSDLTADARRLVGLDKTTTDEIKRVLGHVDTKPKTADP